MSTYLAAAAGDATLALELYGWNARMSAALMLPAHFGEVTTRNAVSDALTAVYGPRWPWDPGFARSLPSSGRYTHRRDLTETAAREATTGRQHPTQIADPVGPHSQCRVTMHHVQVGHLRSWARCDAESVSRRAAAVMPTERLVQGIRARPPGQSAQ
jgi:hypothetical protein